MDEAMEKAVLGQAWVVADDKTRKALRWVRLHRMLKVRLDHLADRGSGKCTVESPMAEFASMDQAEAFSSLALALQRMMQAWAYAEPSQSGQIIALAVQALLYI